MPNTGIKGLRRRTVLKGMALAGASTAIGTPAIAQSQTLVINSNANNDQTAALLRKFADEFGKEFNCSVSVNVQGPDTYNTAIRNFLVTSPPDICFWYSGERMRTFVRRGLFEDVTDLWEERGFHEPTGSLTNTVSLDGRQYGIPTEAAFIGQFYRKDLLEQAGVSSAPKTWDELLATCEALKGSGVTPYAMGSRDPWTTGYFFDQINLRVNGLDYYMRLMEGEASYLDPEVHEIFDYLGQLVKGDYFTPNHTSYDWQQGATFFSQGRAGQILIGQFVRRFLPEEIRDLVGFTPFPTIDPSIGPYEEFTTNSMHIPSGAKNKELAREFLAFFYRPENVAQWIIPEGYLPPRTDVPIQDDPILQAGLDMMAAAKGSAQFYDRDTVPEMAQIGMSGFQEFMVDPSRLDAILQRLDAARERIFNT